jgi:uncharacterized protein (TIGR00730 family)
LCAFFVSLQRKNLQKRNDMKIGIFCSANNQIDNDFFLETEKLGRWLASEGHEIVFGGVNQGLMECVARAAKEAGGTTLGVVPSIVEETGRTSRYNDRVLTCQNLSERKQLMLDESDIFIALPGGIGTLDEIFTVASAATINYHQKRVILFNMNGFWDSLIAMLNDLEVRGVMRRPWKDHIVVAETLDGVIKCLHTVG